MTSVESRDLELSDEVVKAKKRMLNDPCDLHARMLSEAIMAFPGVTDLPVDKLEAVEILEWMSKNLDVDRYSDMAVVLGDRVNFLQVNEVEDESPDDGEGPRTEAPTLNEILDDPILKHFDFQNIPERMRSAGERYQLLALGIVRNSRKCEERDVALRKLLESRDCLFRAAFG